MKTLALALLVAAPGAAAAQAAPKDVTAMPPVSGNFSAKRTAWGDPDLRGQFSLDNVGRVPFERPDSAGDRAWLNDAEFAARLESARKSDAQFSADNTRGTKGLAAWIASEPFARRSSALIDPANGKLPALLPDAEALRRGGRSSWVPNGTYDWVDDFDTWDRCISRGFPASMMPFRYNNGVRIFQAPGYVAIHFEMLGDRIIPLRRGDHWPAAVESWMGSSLGHWDGRTLVVETTNIKAGDDTTRDVTRRAASPLNVATGVASNNAIPVSAQARAIERFTWTGPNALSYELTYSDPLVFTAPWTTRVTWTRDDSYQFFEYACHEGNVSVRNYIVASRTARGDATAALARTKDVP